jgi:hypothetical protein
MAREPQNLIALAESVRWAWLAVNAAIPLPFQVAGQVMVEASPEQEHLMTLRETAFEMLLTEILDNEVGANAEDLMALANGQIPVITDEEYR